MVDSQTTDCPLCHGSGTIGHTYGGQPMPCPACSGATAPVQQTTDRPLADQEITMALCAVRYCIGRRSYVVADGIKWARRYGAESAQFRRVLIRDLEEASARHDNNWLALGDEMDAREWRSVMIDLKALEAANGCSTIM